MTRMYCIIYGIVHNISLLSYPHISYYIIVVYYVHSTIMSYC